MLLVSVLLLTTWSCNSTKKIAYLQDATIGGEVPVSQTSNIVARPGDRIAIVVNCADPQASALFTLLSPQMQFVAGENATGGGTQNVNSYLVDNSGNINFPVLGKLHVGGLTATQIASKVCNDLVTHQLVKDPVVQASFTNLHYSVTGEVKSPGKYEIGNDRVTVLEALAAAGDLTIFGRRDNVKVVREVDGKRTTYQLDLRSDHLFDSPAYYLQQNDVIYVEPNSARAGQSSVNENNWKSVSIWISLASLLTTVAVLVFK